jgi:hypothetical protein
MLLMPLPSEGTTKNVSGGEYEAKAFGFLNLILMLAATTAPQFTQLRLAPQARLSCRLASSACGTATS